MTEIKSSIPTKLRGAKYVERLCPNCNTWHEGAILSNLDLDHNTSPNICKYYKEQ